MWRSCRASWPHVVVQSRSRCFADAFPRNYKGLWSNTSFEELGIHPKLVHALAAQNIVRPTVVQAGAFVPVAKGKDVVLRAETGSGKTLAYLLPLLNRVYHLHDRARELVKADSNAANPLQSSRPWVVLAPTSDLCAQILAMLSDVDVDRLLVAQSLQQLVKWEARPSNEESNFRSPKFKERTTLIPGQVGVTDVQNTGAQLSVHNGHSRSASKSVYATASPRIPWGAVDLVVSTPAHFRATLDQCREDGIFPACVVMDEADALFHGKSRLDIIEVVGEIRPRVKIRQLHEPRKRLPDLIPTQFVFSAATILHIGPFSVGNMLIERFCTAHTVETKNFHRLPTGLDCTSIRWRDGSDDWDQRVQQLIDVIREVPCERTLVFANSVQNGHVLRLFLKQLGWPVTSFMKGPQGRMGPRFRDAQRFADGHANIMIATDFGGRGIDWPDINHVINFQMPTDAVSWLHRVGRTGRMGKSGLVTNFIGTKDKLISDMIQQRLASEKDMHNIFSRKRSLRRWRRADHDEASSETSPSYSARNGVYQLEGGLELFEQSIQHDESSNLHETPGTSDEFTLLGYLPYNESPPRVMSKRAKQMMSQYGSGGKHRKDLHVKGEQEDEEGTEVTEGTEGTEDVLADFRRELLHSDSESDAEGSAEDELSDSSEIAPGAEGDMFSWSKLGDETEGAVVARPPRASVPRQPPDRNAAKRQLRRFEPDQFVGSRKRLGVNASSRIAASRNYAEPDDDLLM